MRQGAQIYHQQNTQTVLQIQVSFVGFEFQLQNILKYKIKNKFMRPEHEIRTNKIVCVLLSLGDYYT